MNINVKVGDKVRVQLNKLEVDYEITTTVLETRYNGREALVEWERGSKKTGHEDVKSWWVYTNPEHENICQYGKILCKNWRRFEKENK